MIFGEKDFSVECEVKRVAGNLAYVRACIFVRGKQIGLFEEQEMLGTMQLTLGSFLRFANNRSVGQASPSLAFEYLHDSMYGEGWWIGAESNYRDKYSLHDVFELSIADQGVVVFFATIDSGKSFLLIGSRGGDFNDFHEVTETSVNKVLQDVLEWMSLSPSSEEGCMRRLH